MNNPIAEAPAKAIPSFQQLAETGSSWVLPAAGIALVLVSGGAALLFLRRRQKKG